VQMNNKPANL